MGFGNEVGVEDVVHDVPRSGLGSENQTMLYTVVYK